MPEPVRKAIILFAPLVLLLGLPPLADSRMAGRRFEREWGRDAVDLVVRKVAVAPIRAHVGDTIRIEMEWDHWGHITDYQTIVATIRANGKAVASQKYPSGFGVRPGEVKREVFLWNTKGTAPGKYRIRGEVPLKYDPTPYNNYLDVKEPVLLIAEGESFPAGQEGGGEAAAEYLR